MTIGNWEGAQWVLITFLVLKTINPVIFKMSGLKFANARQENIEEWLGRYLTNITSTTFLVTILYWGGFWE